MELPRERYGSWKILPKPNGVIMCVIEKDRLGFRRDDGSWVYMGWAMDSVFTQNGLHTAWRLQ